MDWERLPDTRKLESLWDAIHLNRQRFTEQARQILKDENLTPFAKRKQVRELHQQALEKHNQLMRQWKEALADYRGMLARTTLRPRSDAERALLTQVQKA
ncbi:MAG: hypothetical protein WHV44_12915, partial [Anaerolineales bacterium]